MNSDLSFTEENYLKTLFHLSENTEQSVSTNAIASSMNTTAASVSDMIRKLSEKNLIDYQKYKGSKLHASGRKIALSIIRKHRLWEVFLYDKLGLKWDEVHEVAEQLEHIKSTLLIDRLDTYLGNPKVDPHGDPIPDENGVFEEAIKKPLSSATIGSRGIIVAVTTDNSLLLQQLDKMKINLGTKIEVLEKMEFDESLTIKTTAKENLFLSKTVADNLLVSFQ